MAAIVNVSSEALDVVAASSNQTSSSEQCIMAEGPREVTITIHVITLLASLVGNTLLITAFVRMKEPIMLLIANMAVSDLLVAIFLIPRLITREIIGYSAFLVHGNGGKFLCKMCTFLSDISLSVSTLSLVLIAVERFLAVVYPIVYKKITVKVRRLLVASTWIMAMAFHSPYFYTMRLVANANHQECQSSWDNRSAQLRYNIFLFITVLLVPLLVISVLYTVIVIKLRKDKMASNRSEKGARRNQVRNRNLQRMAVATVTAILICWTLYSIIYFMILFSPETIPKCSKSFKIVYYISRVLASSYCAVNPCICFIFVRNFSRQLRIMCKRKGHGLDRKVRGESSVNNNCRIELRQLSSESTQTMSLLRNENNHCSSNVSTSLGSLQQNLI